MAFINGKEIYFVETNGGVGIGQSIREFAVPLRLSALPTTTGFRQGGSVYVDDGQSGFRMSMLAIKELNTKIVTTDDPNNVDMSKLTIDDYIYERSKK